MKKVTDILYVEVLACQEYVTHAGDVKQLVQVCNSDVSRDDLRLCPWKTRDTGVPWISVKCAHPIPRGIVAIKRSIVGGVRHFYYIAEAEYVFKKHDSADVIQLERHEIRRVITELIDGHVRSFEIFFDVKDFKKCIDEARIYELVAIIPR